MESKVDKWKEKIDSYFENITREEFIKHLEDAGFEVTDDGTVQIINSNGS